MKQFKISKSVLFVLLFIFACFNTTNAQPWKAYTIIDPSLIKSFSLSPSNVLWSITNKSIYTFDGQDWKAETLLTNNESYSAIAADLNNTIWVTNGYKILYKQNNQWHKVDSSYYYTLGIQFRKIFVDGQNRKWFLTNNRGLIMFDGLNWKKYDTTNSDLSSNLITDFAYDINNNIWCSTNLGGVCKFDGTNWTSYNPVPQLANANYVTIAVDAASNIYTIENNATYMLKSNGANWTVIPMPFQGAVDMKIDGFNTVWVGHQNGLYKFDGTNWTYFATGLNGDAISVTSELVFDINSNILFMNNYFESKITLYCKTNMSWIKIEKPTYALPNELYFSLCNTTNSKTYFMSEDNLVDQNSNGYNVFPIWGLNNLYELTNNLFLVGKKDTTLITSDFINFQNIGHIKNGKQFWKDTSGQIWQASDSYGLSNASLLDQPLNPNFIPIPFPSSISLPRPVQVDRNNNFWFACQKFGLLKYDGNNWTVYDTILTGAPIHDVFCIAIDTAQIKWVGCYGDGLFRFDGTNWTQFNTTNSGIAGDRLLGVAIDKQQHIWCAAEGHGLIMFDGINWINYTTQNSPLLSNNIYHVSVDQNDVIWIVSDGSIYSYHYNVATGLVPANTSFLEVYAYPNPASENIQIKGLKENDYVQVFDLKGNVLFQSNIAMPLNFNINISLFSKGQYLYKITRKDQVMYGKFIK